MSLYVLTGPLLNALARSSLAPEWVPADDATFAGTNVCDGRSDIPAFWSSSTSDPTMTADLCLVSDPGFETSTTGWTASSTDLTFSSSSGTVYAGSFSAIYSASATSEYAYSDISVCSGETLRLSWAMMTDASTASPTLALQNLQTGNYLSSDGTWTSAVGTLATTASTDWTTGDLTFDVEPTTTTLIDTSTLRLTVAATTLGTVRFDELVLIPEIDWCSIHGHNFTSAVTPLFQSHTDPGYWRTQATMTLSSGSFYSVLSSGVLARYWRLKLSGTPTAAPYVGEVIMGKARALTDRPLYGGQLEEREAQVRMTTGDGALWIYERGSAPLRKLSFDFTQASSSGYEEMRDFFFNRTRGGLFPCVVAPADMESELVIYGHIAESAVWVKSGPTIRTAGWEVTELPLPHVDYEP